MSARGLATGVGRHDRERGAAVVEFVMISVLLVFLLFAVLQVAAVFYVRNVIAAAASDAARYAASAGADPARGGTRANDLISTGLSAGVSAQVPCSGTVSTDARSGLAVVQVSCTGKIRSLLLPLAAFTSIHVVAHSLQESP